MEFFYWDIETCGQHETFKDFEMIDERGSNLFKSKYEKMNWVEQYGSIDNAYLEQSPVISTYGKICCISVGYVGDSGEKKLKSYFGDNEEKILNEFNELMKSVEKKSFTLLGYRIFYFDVPWVLHKMHKYNIVPASILYMYDKKPWESRMRDLSEDWKQKFAYTLSYDEVCYELGVDSPKSKMSGKDVHKTYWKGDYEAIAEYCEQDVSTLFDVAKKVYK